MTAEIQPRDGTLQVNGLRLHYLEWGTAGQPAMVLLHGLTSHAHSWDHVASAFADRYHIIALDQRGHGDSAWPSNRHYDTADFVADTAAVMDALSLRQAILIGLSMGAHNALAFAATHPDRVTKLVVVDIGPQYPPDGAADANDEGAPAPPPPPRIFASVDEAFRLARTSNPRPPEALQRDRVRWGLRDRPDATVEWKFDPAAPDAWTPANLWAALPSVVCPTLIVRGALSDILPADVATRMTETLPNARLVTIDGSGHTVPLDRPTEFEQAVRDFLAEGAV